MRWWWGSLCTRPTLLAGFLLVLAHWSKDLLAGNQDNVLWGDMSIHEMLLQWASTSKNPAKSVGLVQSEPCLFIENYNVSCQIQQRPHIAQCYQKYIFYSSTLSKTDELLWQLALVRIQLRVLV
jgi:hypothetical protein